MGRFSDIIGEQQIRSHMQHALRSGHVSHALLITGDEGMGKKMIARTFSQALLCENRQEINGLIEPCCECPSCIRAMAGTHPDLRELVRTKTNYSVDDIRTQLVADIMLRPISGDRRIYIIPEADNLNPACQNALLKTLEEPPSYAVIIMLTERPGTLLSTITSRTVTLPLKPVQDQLITAFLMEKHRLPDYKARECTAFAEGNVGKALRFASDDRYRTMVDKTASLLGELDGLTVAEIRQRLSDILLPETDTGEAKAVSKKLGLKDAGMKELSSFLDLLMILNRDAMVFKAGEPGKLVFASEEAYDVKASKRPWRTLYNNMTIIEEARSRLNSNVNTDLSMELLLLGIKNGELL